MKNLIVFTGAGISAPSGISTFRDKNGLWENYSVDVVANHLTWKKNREIVYDFYNKRRQDIAKAMPNPAHDLIAKWQKDYSATIITQNIDDLFEKAGCVDVMHVHGSISEMKCEACGNIWDIGTSDWNIDDKCPNCPSKKGVKPNVIFFHENAPLYADMWRIFDSLTSKDCVVVIGTSGQVIDIDSIIAKSNCTSILCNLEKSAILNDKHFTYSIYGSIDKNIEPLDSLVSQIVST